MKKVLFSFLTILVLVFSVQSANAHVLITDETKTKGAVLHIVPDDDPIAGQQASFYLDVQSKLDGEVKLSVTDSTGNTNDVITKTVGSLATANYTFPTQGVYELSFTTISEGKTYTFKQSQRVSRGVASSALSKPSYAWAEMLLLASGIGFALLLINVVNRRKDIARQSKW